ncbi:Latent-transforming growth factor beta-binding protein 2 [Aphelenchoides besseyi]|nr:Latent-transforming growth factor beta-binding protein 2 [Aphelenchoides besseyi]
MREPFNLPGIIQLFFISILSSEVNGLTKFFDNGNGQVNSSVFAINFDISTVICQHSANVSDIHVHDLSVLCDGVNDCYADGAINDENFSFCESTCNAKCSGNGACLYNGFQSQCYCNRGGFYGSSCEFIAPNLCNGKKCHEMARCHNTFGTYNCECVVGYEGSGTECSEVNECAENMVTCPLNSVCVNLPGTHMCNCTSGFEGVGLPIERCEDIDECTTGSAQCAPGMLCENTIGSYRCVRQCSVGYKFDGNSGCVDESIMEYLVLTVAEPMQYAEAVFDRYGGCVDVNECQSSIVCKGVDEWCVNMLGGYLCCNEHSTSSECRDQHFYNTEIAQPLKKRMAPAADADANSDSKAHGGSSKSESLAEAEAIVPNDQQNNENNLEQSSSFNDHTNHLEEEENEQLKFNHQNKSRSGGYVLVRGPTDSPKKSNSSNQLPPLAISGGLKFALPSCGSKSSERCPDYSVCVSNQCRCRLGFEWNSKVGRCQDINECNLEPNPCKSNPNVDVWCVNTVGNFSCCSSGVESKEEGCAGLEIVAMPAYEQRKNKSTTRNNSTAINELRGRLRMYKEWKNFTGGQLIIGRKHHVSTPWGLELAIGKARGRINEPNTPRIEEDGPFPIDNEEKYQIFSMTTETPNQRTSSEVVRPDDELKNNFKDADHNAKSKYKIQTTSRIIPTTIIEQPLANLKAQQTTTPKFTDRFVSPPTSPKNQEERFFAGLEIIGRKIDKNKNKADQQKMPRPEDQTPKTFINPKKTDGAKSSLAEPPNSHKSEEDVETNSHSTVDTKTTIKFNRLETSTSDSMSTTINEDADWIIEPDEQSALDKKQDDHIHSSTYSTSKPSTTDISTTTQQSQFISSTQQSTTSIKPSTDVPIYDEWIFNPKDTEAEVVFKTPKTSVTELSTSTVSIHEEGLEIAKSNIEKEGERSSTTTFAVRVKEILNTTRTTTQQPMTTDAQKVTTRGDDQRNSQSFKNFEFPNPTTENGISTSTPVESKDLQMLLPTSTVSGMDLTNRFDSLSTSTVDNKEKWTTRIQSHENNKFSSMTSSTTTIPDLPKTTDDGDRKNEQATFDVSKNIYSSTEVQTTKSDMWNDRYNKTTSWKPTEDFTSTLSTQTVAKTDEWDETTISFIQPTTTINVQQKQVLLTTSKQPPSNANQPTDRTALKSTTIHSTTRTSQVEPLNSTMLPKISTLKAKSSHEFTGNTTEILQKTQSTERPTTSTNTQPEEATVFSTLSPLNSTQDSTPDTTLKQRLTNNYKASEIPSTSNSMLSTKESTVTPTSTIDLLLKTTTTEASVINDNIIKFGQTQPPEVTPSKEIEITSTKRTKTTEVVAETPVDNSIKEPKAATKENKTTERPTDDRFKSSHTNSTLLPSNLGAEVTSKQKPSQSQPSDRPSKTDGLNSTPSIFTNIVFKTTETAKTASHVPINDKMGRETTQPSFYSSTFSALLPSTTRATKFFETTNPKSIVTSAAINREVYLTTEESGRFDDNNRTPSITANSRYSTLYNSTTVTPKRKNDGTLKSMQTVEEWLSTITPLNQRSTYNPTNKSKTTVEIVVNNNRSSLRSTEVTHKWNTERLIVSTSPSDVEEENKNEIHEGRNVKSQNSFSSPSTSETTSSNFSPIATKSSTIGSSPTKSIVSSEASTSSTQTIESITSDVTLQMNETDVESTTYHGIDTTFSSTDHGGEDQHLKMTSSQSFLTTIKSSPLSESETVKPEDSFTTEVPNTRDVTNPNSSTTPVFPTNSSKAVQSIFNEQKTSSSMHTTISTEKPSIQPTIPSLINTHNVTDNVETLAMKKLNGKNENGSVSFDTTTKFVPDNQLLTSQSTLANSIEITKSSTSFESSTVTNQPNTPEKMSISNPLTDRKKDSENVPSTEGPNVLETSSYAATISNQPLLSSNSSSEEPEINKSTATTTDYETKKTSTESRVQTTKTTSTDKVVELETSRFDETTVTTPEMSMITSSHRVDSSTASDNSPFGHKELQTTLSYYTTNVSSTTGAPSRLRETTIASRIAEDLAKTRDYQTRSDKYEANTPSLSTKHATPSFKSTTSNEMKIISTFPDHEEELKTTSKSNLSDFLSSTSRVPTSNSHSPSSNIYVTTKIFDITTEISSQRPNLNNETVELQKSKTDAPEEVRQSTFEVTESPDVMSQSPTISQFTSTANSNLETELLTSTYQYDKTTANVKNEMSQSKSVGSEVQSTFEFFTSPPTTEMNLKNETPTNSLNEMSRTTKTIDETNEAFDRSTLSLVESTTPVIREVPLEKKKNSHSKVPFVTTIVPQSSTESIRSPTRTITSKEFVTTKDNSHSTIQDSSVVTKKSPYVSREVVSSKHVPVATSTISTSTERIADVKTPILTSTLSNNIAADDKTNEKQAHTNIVSVMPTDFKSSTISSKVDRAENKSGNLETTEFMKTSSTVNSSPTTLLVESNVTQHAVSSFGSTTQKPTSNSQPANSPSIQLTTTITKQPITPKVDVKTSTLKTITTTENKKIETNESKLDIFTIIQTILPTETSISNSKTRSTDQTHFDKLLTVNAMKTTVLPISKSDSQPHINNKKLTTLPLTTTEKTSLPLDASTTHHFDLTSKLPSTSTTTGSSNVTQSLGSQGFTKLQHQNRIEVDETSAENVPTDEAAELRPNSTPDLQPENSTAQLGLMLTFQRPDWRNPSITNDFTTTPISVSNEHGLIITSGRHPLIETDDENVLTTNENEVNERLSSSMNIHNRLNSEETERSNGDSQMFSTSPTASNIPLDDSDENEFSTRPSVTHVVKTVHRLLNGTLIYGRTVRPATTTGELGIEISGNSRASTADSTKQHGLEISGDNSENWPNTTPGFGLVIEGRTKPPSKDNETTLQKTQSSLPPQIITDESGSLESENRMANVQQNKSTTQSTEEEHLSTTVNSLDFTLETTSVPLTTSETSSFMIPESEAEFGTTASNIVDFTTIGLTDEATEQTSTLRQEVVTNSVGSTETVTRSSPSPQTTNEVLTTESISVSTSLPFDLSTSSAPSSQQTSSFFVMNSKKPEDYSSTIEPLSSNQPKETTEVGIRGITSVEPEASSTTPFILNRHIIVEETTSQSITKEVNELTTEELTTTTPTAPVQSSSELPIQVTSNPPAQQTESVPTKEPSSTDHPLTSTLETVHSSTRLFEFSIKSSKSTSTQSTNEETFQTKGFETQTPSAKSTVEERPTSATTESSDSEKLTSGLSTIKPSESTKVVESGRATTVPITPEPNIVATISSKPDVRVTEKTEDFESTNQPEVFETSTQYVEFTTSVSSSDETIYSTTSTIELTEKPTETASTDVISSSTKVNDSIQSTTLQPNGIVSESTRFAETTSTIVNTINPTIIPFEPSIIDNETSTTSAATLQSTLSTETLKPEVTATVSSEALSTQSPVINEHKPVVETSTILADKSDNMSAVESSTSATETSTSSPNELVTTSIQSEKPQSTSPEIIPTKPNDEVSVQSTTLPIAPPKVEIDGDENTEEEFGPQQRLPTSPQTKETTVELQLSTEPARTESSSQSSVKFVDNTRLVQSKTTAGIFTESASSTATETFAVSSLANEETTSSSVSTSVPSTETFDELSSTQTVTIKPTNLPENNLTKVPQILGSTLTNNQNENTETSTSQSTTQSITQSTTDSTSFIPTTQSQTTNETSDSLTENTSGSTVGNMETTWSVETKQSSEHPTTHPSLIQTDHTPEPTGSTSSTNSEFGESSTTLQPLAETVPISTSRKSETSDENVPTTSESAANSQASSTIGLSRIPEAFDFTAAIKQESVTASNTMVDSSVRSDETKSSNAPVNEIESASFASTTTLPKETAKTSTSQSIQTKTQSFTSQPDLIFTAKPVDLEITTQESEKIAEMSTPSNVPISTESFEASTRSISLESSTVTSDIHFTTNVEVSSETSTDNSKVKDVIPESSTGFINQQFESSVQPVSSTSPTTSENESTAKSTTQKAESSILTTESVATESKTTENVQPITSTESVVNQESSVTSSSSLVSSSTKTASTSSVEQHSTATPELSVPSQSPFVVRLVTTPKSRVSVRTTTSDSRLIANERTIEPNRCTSSNECGLDAICNRTTGACECRAGFEPIQLSSRVNKEHGILPGFMDNEHRGNLMFNGCVDIDECQQGIHNCHPSALCINTVGSFNCQCAPSNADCLSDKSSSCTEDWTNYCRGYNKTCFVDEEEILQCGGCLHGFQPLNGKCLCDGIHCDDINECSMGNPCSENMKCQNTIGAFECVPTSEETPKTPQIVNEESNQPSTITNQEEDRLSPEYETTTPSFEQTTKNAVEDGFSTSLPSLRTDPSTSTPLASTTLELVTSSAGILSTTSVKVSSTNILQQTTENTIGRSNLTSSTSTSFPQHHSEYTTNVPEVSSSTKTTSGIVEVLKCSSTNGESICHELANCNLETGMCYCRLGYVGDGYSSCTRIWEDCRSDETVCDRNAYCNSTTTQCNCKSGFSGDGFTCVPDRLDCEVRNVMCSEFATCTNRRCICNEGYAGDGITCMSLTPVTNRFDCLACHCRADCINDECLCKQGFMGNGLACVPDPEDCVNYPAVCHINGYCNNSTRRCECRKEYLGDGYDCSERRSCTDNPNLCHADADCLSSGQCRCRMNYFGDGYSCYRQLTIAANETLRSTTTECPNYCGPNAECINGACRCLAGYLANQNGLCQDIDECRVGAAACQPSARCRNVEGSYECRCPDGTLDAGRNCEPLENVANCVELTCESNGMRVQLSNDTTQFIGRVYVLGQSENSLCSANYLPTPMFESHGRQPQFFFVSHSDCVMELEDKNTLATTIVVQQHTFAGDQSNAYRLRCGYPFGSKAEITSVNVTEHEIPEETYRKEVQPTCEFEITDFQNVGVSNAVVGQPLKLLLTVHPNETYGVAPLNCFAINVKTEERRQLTDESGCTSDFDLFAGWQRVTKSRLQATLRTFKWPESDKVRFECDCTPCFGSCIDVDCNERHYARRMMRYRRQESTNDGTAWLKNLNGRSAIAFSAVIDVHEHDSSSDTTSDIASWLSSIDVNNQENREAVQANDQFLRSSIAWLCAGLLAALVIGMLIVWFEIRRARKQKKLALARGPSHRSNSSYIQF